MRNAFPEQFMKSSFMYIRTYICWAHGRQLIKLQKLTLAINPNNLYVHVHSVQVQITYLCAELDNEQGIYSTANAKSCVLVRDLHRYYT